MVLAQPVGPAGVFLVQAGPLDFLARPEKKVKSTCHLSPVGDGIRKKRLNETRTWR